MDEKQSESYQIYKGNITIKRSLHQNIGESNICMVPFKYQLSKDKKFSNSYSLQYLIPKCTLQLNLNSKFIVKNISYTWNEECFIVIQESYPTNLVSLLNDKLTQYQANIDILSDIADSLAYLNSCRIIVRDLRPQTIAVVPRYEYEPTKAKIIILNDAVKQETPKISQAPLTITKYTAPELLLDQTYCSKVDIWSLGCIFYQMLFGSLPGIDLRGKKTVLKFPDYTPGWMVQILTNMLQFQPDDRYDLQSVRNRIKFLKDCAEAAGKIFDKS